MTNPDLTLSVVLTVHNAEKTLAGQVSRLLETLPDLAARFELLIVDDGSTDQTEEVAHELAVSYPQLRVARHANQLGTDAAAKTAMQRTTGDVVVLHEGSTSLAAHALRRVWELHPDVDRLTENKPAQHSSLPTIPAHLPVSPNPFHETADEPPPCGMSAPRPWANELPHPPTTPAASTTQTRARPSGSAGPSLPRIVARLVAQRHHTPDTDCPPNTSDQDLRSTRSRPSSA